MKKRIAFVGAGAVGGYLGGHFARTGQDVTLIDPWPDHIETIRARGIHLSGMTADETCTLQVPTMHLTEVQAISKQKPIDIAFISVKSYDTEWATSMIRPYLSPEGFVVSAQNSINEEKIASVVGWGRTVGCILSNNFAVDLYAPGHVRRTMPRDFKKPSIVFGEVHGRVTKRVEQLREFASAIDGADVTTNLWGDRWSKLCVNSMRNSVSAVTGMGGNERDSHEIIRRVVIRLGGEAVRVGQMLGYELGSVAGIEPGQLVAASDGDAAALGAVVAHMSKQSTQAARSDLQRPSMAQDMQKGRRTEISEINGLIADKGREVGCLAPTHERMVEIVRSVENGQVAPRPELLFFNS